MTSFMDWLWIPSQRVSHCSKECLSEQYLWPSRAPHCRCCRWKSPQGWGPKSQSWALPRSFSSSSRRFVGKRRVSRRRSIPTPQGHSLLQARRTRGPEFRRIFTTVSLPWKSLRKWVFWPKIHFNHSQPGRTYVSTMQCLSTPPELETGLIR